MKTTYIRPAGRPSGFTHPRVVGPGGGGELRFGLNGGERLKRLSPILICKVCFFFTEYGTHYLGTSIQNATHVCKG